MIESLLITTISDLLLTAVNSITLRSRSTDFDFLIQDQKGKRIAIEVYGEPPSKRQISRLLERSILEKDHIDQLVIVTPDQPSEKHRNLFFASFQELNKPHSWIGLNSLPELIGIESPGDLTSPKVIADLQTEALMENVNRYENVPVGPDLPDTELLHQYGATMDDISREYLTLKRQFSFSTISKLRKTEGDLQQLLRLGQSSDNVTVVLSDLKNFSSLVKVSLPDDLKDAMNKYYSMARRLVWKHSGTLDKFIGDAVLAVFGYPFPSAEAAVNAIRFSRELILEGRRILNNWQREINENIETGTRVGISTGPIWTLDIGDDGLEISFVGDTINLAARLEKSSSPDAILIEQRTRTRARQHDRGFVGSLELIEGELKPEQAKGQLFPIRTWQVPPITKQQAVLRAKR